MTKLYQNLHYLVSETKHIFYQLAVQKKIIENASPGAAVTVSASANLEKEGTVDLVLLGSENRGQVLSHLEMFLVPLLLAPLNSFQQIRQSSWNHNNKLINNSINETRTR